MDGTIMSTPVIRRGKKEKGLLFCIVCGTGGCVLLVLLFSLLSATLAYRQGNPGTWVAPLSYLSAFLAAFGGGAVAARTHRRSGLLCGVLTGIGVLLVFTAGLLLCRGDGEISPAHLIPFYSLLFVATVLGGVIGGVRIPHAKKRRRH